MKRVIAFILGLLFLLFVLEVGIRLSGVLYLLGRKTVMRSSNDKSSRPFIILCLGNSYTLGCGAPKGESYPEQLQRLFDRSLSGQKVLVINGGVGNQNTSELLRSLDDRLNEYNPDLVVLQTGQANIGNYSYYDAFLKRNHLGASNSRRTRWFSWNDIFYSSRLYRMVFILVTHLRQNKEQVEAFPYRDEESYNNADRFIQDHEQLFFVNNQPVEMSQQKYQEMKNLFLHGIERDPTFPANYYNLGLLCCFKHDFASALEWFKKAVRVNPMFRSTNEINRAYAFIRLLRTMDKGPQNNELNDQIDVFINESKRMNPQTSIQFLLLTEQEINAWAEADIREIVMTVRGRKKQIILQTYPMSISMNDMIRSVARDIEIPLVDNELFFKDKLAEPGVGRDDFFVADGHCNAKGYGLVAKNVYRKIQNTGWLINH